MGPAERVAALGFGELLALRAADAPDELAFTFARDDDEGDDTVTYAELHAAAATVASALRQALPDGARVLILFPPGLDYVAAVFGCFYAGAIGVSAAPPHPKRLHRTLPRLLAIAADADVDAVLTTDAIREAASALAAGDGPLARASWLTATDAAGEPDLEPLPRRLHDLAFLQYTSGSTSDPRGVMLTHGNLVDNSEFIARAFGHSEDSRGFIWLPPYHDMGLIGGILQPVYVGFPCALTSPLGVIKRPAWWLEGVSRFRATTSGGPNFAYDLCVERIGEEARAELDLSSWEVAFNGAEPIRAATIDSFSAAFGPCGFRRSAFFPCYGLAEATLMVTAVAKEDEPVLRAFDGGELQRGRAVAPAAGERSPRLVGCGAPEPGNALEVVDPVTLARCEPGRIGELWVAGPSVAAGYWRRPEDTAAAFAARIADDPAAGPFLRTGDLGVVDGDELFVAGRLKDVLIVRGRNYHPHDIEEAAEAAHPLLRAHCSAAFAAEPGGEVELGMVLEVDEGGGPDPAAVAAAARAGVAREFDLQLHRVALCSPGAVPKTTSGKTQRALCRALLESGELETILDWHHEEG